MSGRVLVGDGADWTGGDVSTLATCVLAPNPSAWTLNGTNTWIVGEADGECVVIDPGPLGGGHEAAILDAIEQRNGRVTNVLLTHGHHDHSEGAVDLANLLHVPLRAWDRTHMQDRRDSVSPLADQERLEINGADLVVMATPGHSSDSVCFVMGNSILTGDTVLGRGTSVVAHPDGRLADYLTSLQLLSRTCADAGIDRLLPGHGPLIDEPRLVVDYYLSHRRERLDQVRAAMAGGAATISEVVDRVYSDVPPEVRWAAESTVAAQLVFLESEGAV